MTDQCYHCGIEEFPHGKAETLGTVNHRWSPTGQLIPVNRNDKGQRAAQRPQIMVVGAIDLNLRQLLYSKGILTDEDLATLLGAGSSAEGDRGTGETSSSE